MNLERCYIGISLCSPDDADETRLLSTHLFLSSETIVQELDWLFAVVHCKCLHPCFKPLNTETPILARRTQPSNTVDNVE
jgi:hypothetical protein